MTESLRAGLMQRAATTGGRLQPTERQAINPRPKTHHPFITKIEVRIKKQSDVENPSRNRSDIKTLQSVRPTNFTYKDPPATRVSSQNSYYEKDSFSLSTKESLGEVRKERRRILGERASAMDVSRENNSLYRPSFSAKDCNVQLQLVRELTEHLRSVGREARRSRMLQRLPAFHSRATKGERMFRVDKWK